jgi:ribosome-binding protein aMBF1 (putative translation factor)
MTLKQARDAKGWTQVELAAKSRIDQAHISKIERGEVCDPKNSTVAALEKALGVRRGTLVFGIQSEALAS